MKFAGTRAVGVEYLDLSGARQEALAEREVVLAAGAVGSPLVLLRSGVGDPDQLRQHGIEMVAASPGVGENLQDHLMCALIYRCSQPVTLVAAERKTELLKYLVRRRGMLTSNAGEAAAFTRSAPDRSAPDLELIFAPLPYIDHGLAPDAPGHGLTVAPVLLQPNSRGTVRLQSADPAAKPLIDPRYLSEPADATALRWGLRQARNLFNTRALAPFVGEPIEAPAGDSDEAVDDFIAEQAETTYHPIGTCRMGTDPGSVVDPQLRVRGTDGLRVADVSVMPRLNRGHTHAPAVMIGERAAELISAR